MHYKVLIAIFVDIGLFFSVLLDQRGYVIPMLMHLVIRYEGFVQADERQVTSNISNHIIQP